MKIPFNIPYSTGKEIAYIKNAISSRKLSGDGDYTKLCQSFFENKYNFKKTLLTTSCTDALELAALLLDIKEGDEIIAPAYTFVSTVNAFVLRGATIIFADSNKENPNLDVDKIEQLITPKTKVIIPVHYAGIACDMDKIMSLAKKYNLFVVEDAALSIDSYYKDKPLGSVGHLATFSFHETKNISAGEGGMLVINDEQFVKRAEIIREKGTNRSAFYRGEVNKYGWMDIGSSFLPSEITAAYLYAQLQELEIIQSRRIQIWKQYYDGLANLKNKIALPIIPEFARNNANSFYIVCKSLEERTSLMSYLSNKEISTAFHYLGLHKSEYYKNKYKGGELRMADKYTDCLLRLPLYYELTDDEVISIISAIQDFFLNKA
ncbi:MAG: dTDP-4-amino-4,6-dideoxygalactose transaminase [Bacteroidota bacterium]